MARILLISRDEMLISRLKEAIKSHPELSLKAAPTYPAAGSWNLLLPEIQSVSDWILCLGQLENDGIPVLPVCTGHVFTEIVQSGLPLMEYLELPLPPDAAQILSVRLQQEYPGPIGESPDSRVLDLWHRVAWGSVSPGRRYIHQVCDRLGIPEEQRSAIPMYIEVKEIHTPDETPERMSQAADLLAWRLRTIAPENCGQIVALSPTGFLALFRYPGRPDYTRLKTCADNLVEFSRTVLCCSVCCYIGAQTDITRIRQILLIMIQTNLDNIGNVPVTVVRESAPVHPQESVTEFAAQQWARYLYADQFERIVDDVQSTLAELDSKGRLHRSTLEKLAQEFSQFVYITLHDYGIQASEFFDTEYYRRLSHLAPESVNHTIKWVRYTIDEIAGHFRREYANTDPVSRVVNYIDTHLSEDLNADVLAEIAHYSKTYLGRAFQRKIGMTFQEYIRLMRMRFAENLLRHTDLTVSRIAEQVGYRSYASFHAQFRRSHNVPPLEYRRQEVSSSEPGVGR